MKYLKSFKILNLLIEEVQFTPHSELDDFVDDSDIKEILSDLVYDYAHIDIEHFKNKVYVNVNFVYNMNNPEEVDMTQYKSNMEHLISYMKSLDYHSVELRFYRWENDYIEGRSVNLVRVNKDILDLTWDKSPNEICFTFTS